MRNYFVLFLFFTLVSRSSINHSEVADDSIICSFLWSLSKNHRQLALFAKVSLAFSPLIFLAGILYLKRKKINHFYLYYCELKNDPNLKWHYDQIEGSFWSKLKGFFLGCVFYCLLVRCLEGDVFSKNYDYYLFCFLSGVASSYLFLKDQYAMRSFVQDLEETKLNTNTEGLRLFDQHIVNELKQFFESKIIVNQEIDEYSLLFKIESELKNNEKKQFTDDFNNYINNFYDSLLHKDIFNSIYSDDLKQGHKKFDILLQSVCNKAGSNKIVDTVFLKALTEK